MRSTAHPPGTDVDDARLLTGGGLLRRGFDDSEIRSRLRRGELSTVRLHPSGQPADAARGPAPGARAASVHVEKRREDAMRDEDLRRAFGR